MREAARLGTTQPSFAVAAETLDRLGGVGISATTVWRHHRETSGWVEAELEGQERQAPQRLVWAEGAVGWIAAEGPIEGHASVSIDGGMILIREEGYREVKVVSVSEVEERKEEVLAEEGDRSAEKRGREVKIKLRRHSYRAVLGDKAAFELAFKGELGRRRVGLAEKITTVNDGAEWIWDLVGKHLPEKCVEVLDWPHVLENLAKAAHAGLGEESPEARRWLEQREEELWAGRLMQVDIALHHLPRRYKERGRVIRRVQEYLDRHWTRLAYARFRAEKRPIGSGSVESAIRNVVQWRMKRGGQRWSRPGATRMLAALGEVHSRRWDTTLQRLDQAA